MSMTWTASGRVGDDSTISEAVEALDAVGLTDEHRRALRGVLEATTALDDPRPITFHAYGHHATDVAGEIVSEGVSVNITRG